MVKYLYCIINRRKMSVLDRLIYGDMGSALQKVGANVLVEPAGYTHIEIPFSTEEELRTKLDPVLDILREWERRRIAKCRILKYPALPPKPPFQMTPESIREKISKYARILWRGIRRLPWGKIAKILAKSAYISAKHLGLAAKEITQMIIEEVKKKPESEQVPILVVLNSLIEARRRGEITEEEYLSTVKLIASQMSIPLKIEYV